MASLISEASAAAAAQAFVRAGSAYEEALRLCDESHCNRSAEILSGAGAAYYSARRLHEAESSILRALAADAPPLPSRDRVAALYNLAATYRAQARYAAAKPRYQEALAAAESIASPTDPSLVPILNGLALVSHDLGEFQLARDFALRAVSIAESNRMGESIDAAASFAAMGMILQSQGSPHDAEAWWKRSLAAREKLLGPENVAVADAQVGLALAYRSEGNVGPAIQLYERAIARYEASRVPSALAAALNNRGRIWMEQGNAKQAESDFRRAIEAWEMSSGKDHPDVAAGLTNLGILLCSTRRFDEAEPVLLRAADIDRAHFAEGHPKLGYDLHNLAVLSMARKRYAEAARQLEQAKAILEHALPPGHPEVGKVLARLAAVQHKQAHLDEADELYRNALQVLDAAWGETSPSLLPVIEDYSSVARSRKDYALAASLDARAMKLRVRQALGKTR